jgi:hypothetical protein
MLAAFCLRLSLGLVAFLPLLPAGKMHPRFFRTQFLTALGLAIVALCIGFDAQPLILWPLICGVVVALVGSVIWTLDPPPLGRTIGWLATLVFAIGAASFASQSVNWLAWADAITSGLLLGGTLTAMLVGHSYLISPGLTIRPLMTMLSVCAVCLLARAAVLAVVAMPLLSASDVAVSSDYWLWFVPRCLIGIGGPLVFGVLAYRTARIHSTQSATGILYVVVICTFIGELFGMLIERAAGMPAQ